MNGVAPAVDAAGASPRPPAGPKEPSPASRNVTEGTYHMTPDELRDALATMGMPQTGLGELLGHDGRVVRSWIAGKSAVPPTAAIVVRLLASGRITAADVQTAARPHDRQRRGG